MGGSFDRAPQRVARTSADHGAPARPQARPDAHELLRLQASIGNRAVVDLLNGAPRPPAVQRYQLNHVSYTGNMFASQAVALRASQGHGLKNIASIKLTGMDMFTASSVPPGKKGVTPKHSEQVVWEAVAGECTSGRRRIEWVYTEREPCGVGAGMKNCIQFLTNLLAKYGVNGNNTPVYYTLTYPTLREVKTVAESIFTQGFVDNADDAYDAAYDLWISEHGDTKEAIRQAQAMFSTIGPWGASTFGK